MNDLAQAPTSLELDATMLDRRDCGLGAPAEVSSDSCAWIFTAVCESVHIAFSAAFAAAGFRCLMFLSTVWFEHAPLQMLRMARHLVQRAETRDPHSWFYRYTSAAARVSLRELLLDSPGFQTWLTAQAIAEVSKSE